MDKSLSGKVALVTGASRGVGRAISTAMADLGASLVLVGRARDALAETAKRVEDAGGTALPVVCDLRDEPAIRRLVDATVSEFSQLDILVNNAGVTHSAPFPETTTDAWDECMAVNARAAFILSRTALPVLKTAVQAHIVNVASVVGVKGYPLQSAYTASKHALRGMSIALAEELKGTNVRVHVLCPGGIDTEMVARVRPDIQRDDLIQPDEIAELVIYLVTHRGRGVIDELRIRRANASPWF